MGSQSFGNIYFDGYAKEFRDAIKSSEALGAVLDAAELITAPPQTSSNLDGQFRQIAKLISAHKDRRVNRDFFFVSHRSWDHHSGLKSGLEDNLHEIDSALEFF